MADDRFHEGELRAQVLAGEEERAGRIVRMVGGAIPADRMEFFERVRLVGLAALRTDGALQASLLEGAPGFLRPIDGSQVTLDGRGQPLMELGLAGDLGVGAPVGLLALDPGTRTRYRLNGFVAEADGRLLTIRLREAFPNCGKYIVAREPVEADAAPAAPRDPVVGPLPATARGLAERADTLVLGTHHPQRGIDISHKAGQPGAFVDVRADGAAVRIPDFAGNSLFNSVGNLLVEDRAAVSIADFDAGVQLRVRGRAQVVYDEPDPDGRSGGTRRFLELAVVEHDLVPLAVPGGWLLRGRSPDVPEVG
jgi:predicted pyridoxine 5'-phosphate oxidase superfamily flavin-nucleotide-binding protein